MKRRYGQSKIPRKSSCALPSQCLVSPIGFTLPPTLSPTKTARKITTNGNTDQTTSKFKITELKDDVLVHNTVKSLTGHECYERFIDSMALYNKQKEMEEQKRSAEQYEAMQKVSAKPPTASLTEIEENNRRNTKLGNVAVIKTIAKQARMSNKQTQNNTKQYEQGDGLLNNSDDWKQISTLWLEIAAYEHNYGKALVQLGNDTLEEANMKIDKISSTISRSRTDEKKLEIQTLILKSMELYRLAGEKDNSSEGWFNLGHLLWTGYPFVDNKGDDSEYAEEEEIDGQKQRQLLQPDKEASLDAFQKAVDLGDCDAMYFVGVHYMSSDTDIMNSKQRQIPEQQHMKNIGLDLIQRAADREHGGALYYLALLHLNGDDDLQIKPCTTDDFVVRLDLAANIGRNADALYLRGTCLYNGDHGYKQNYMEALQDFMSSAKLGNSDAAVSAGAMLHRGVPGVIVKDQHEAFKLYQWAGEMGNTEGWRNVVACYAHGEGVPKNLETAKHIAKTMLKTAEL